MVPPRVWARGGCSLVLILPTHPGISSCSIEEASFSTPAAAMKEEVCLQPPSCQAAKCQFGKIAGFTAQVFPVDSAHFCEMLACALQQ